MILAGDVGGTNTRLGLYDRRTPRPAPVTAQSFPTLDFPGLVEMIAAFIATARASVDLPDGAIDAAGFGVAGPVFDGTAQLTNVPWRVDAREVARAFGVARVALVNDLIAMAHAVPVLGPGELQTLQTGEARRGNMALIAAGTGLGQALLHDVDGRFVPSPTEAGHADFAARTDADIAVLRALTARFGRAEVEDVISGPGLVNLHAVTHAGRETGCPAMDGRSTGETDRRGAAEGAPARITAAALGKRCPGCVDALDLFVRAFGAEAGNLAVRSVSTAGLFIGGGIAPKILSALSDGRFMSAFRDKGPMRPLVTAMPVHVILHDDPGLLGAAVVAAAP